MMDVNPCAVSPAMGYLDGAREHLQTITSFSCSTKGQDIQNMMTESFCLYKSFSLGLCQII